MSSIEALQNVRPRVRINGTDQANMGEAVLALQVHLPHCGMANAELRLLNWGGGDPPDFVFSNVQLGNSIEILLGESADTPIFKGDITAIEERYGDGAPQIVILAEDALHRLARQRFNRVFEQKSLNTILQEIASDTGLQADINVADHTATWLQVNESNLAFLLRQIAPYDVALRIENNQLRIRSDEPDSNPIQLDMQNQVVQARLIADLNQLPSQVTVQGYNLDSDEAVSSNSSSISPAPSGQTGTSILQDLSWNSESTLPHPFARSQQEADTLAERQFRQRARRFVHGEIICRDSATLRCGREVELQHTSPRFAGRYRVMECWHLFDTQNGLRTRIKVERADWERV